MKLKSVISLIIILSAFIPAQVDYQSQIQPIFNNNCTGCHGGTSGITLTSYNSVTNSTGNQYGTLVVIPFNATSSPLYDKVRLDKSPDHGDRMPRGGSLSQSQVDLIMSWINEGANETTVSTVADLSQPKGIELIGNYPNPFNPVTKLIFEIDQPSAVDLIVFDMSGKQILQLEGDFQAGWNDLVVNMENQPSSVYLYVLSTGESTGPGQKLYGKMTLLK